MSTASQTVLSGRGILVTRPAQQADALCALIEASGGRAVRFPVLEIHPADDADRVQASLAHLAEYDLAIFVSANAVRHTFLALAPRAWPNTLKIAAIGSVTAQALTAQGQQVELAPLQEFTSEALLALPQLQRVAGQRMLILRGNGGRETLRDILVERGAQVDYLEVYRREDTLADPAQLLERWRRGAIDVVLISSYESLQKLVAIIGTLGLALLNQTTVIVGNARTRDAASALGLQSPIWVAQAATDAAMLAALHTYFTEVKAR